MPKPKPKPNPNPNPNPNPHQVRRDFVKGERRLSPELAELTPQLLQDA